MHSGMQPPTAVAWSTPPRSFNGKFRDECLSLEWFRTRTEARVVIERWRKDYNRIRPHSSLGNLTPHEFRLGLESTAPLAEAVLN